MRWNILPALVLLLAGPPCRATGFVALGLRGSQLDAIADDARSAAGNVVGGDSGGFRWRLGERARLLDGAVSVRAISMSGHYIAGSSLDHRQREVATYWDDAGIPHALGALPGVTLGNVLSVAFGITDALQIVGSAATAADHSAAFRWNPVEGMHALSAPDAGSALGISRDGSRIYGWTQPRGLPRHGALWRADGKAVSPDLDAQVDELTGGNGSASVLFGVADDSGGRRRPYRWVPGTPAQNLTRTNLRSADSIHFDAGSADGAIAVGSSGSGSGAIAFVWTPAGGAQALAEFLALRSIPIPHGWTLNAATAISGDGHHLGGFGLHDGAFDSFIVDLTSTSGTDAPPVHPAAP